MKRGKRRSRRAGGGWFLGGSPVDPMVCVGEGKRGRTVCTIVREHHPGQQAERV